MKTREEMIRSVIPVPDEVLVRQELLRHAREATRVMYGHRGPYELSTNEYNYFVNQVYNADTA